MERLTSQELDELKGRAQRFIGQAYPVPGFVKGSTGRRTLNEIMCEFIGITNSRGATAERKKENEIAIVTFPMPRAIFKCPKGVERKIYLDEVVANFEARAQV